MPHRSLRFATLMFAALTLGSALPGCGGQTETTTGPSPSPEVKIVPPTDASGKTYDINDESKNTPAK